VDNQYSALVNKERLAQQQQYSKLQADAEVAKQAAVQTAKQQVQGEASREAAKLAQVTESARQQAADDANKTAEANAKLAEDQKRQAVQTAQQEAEASAKQRIAEVQRVAEQEANRVRERARALEANLADRQQTGRADADALKDALQKAQDAEDAANFAKQRTALAEQRQGEALNAHEKDASQAEAKLAEKETKWKAAAAAATEAKEQAQVARNAKREVERRLQVRSKVCAVEIRLESYLKLRDTMVHTVRLF